MYNVFIFDYSKRSNNTIEIDGEEFKHIKVKRLHVNDNIILVDGNGLAIQGYINQIYKDRCIVKVEKEIPEYGELSKDIAICMGITDKERMEWWVEKSTELGVRRIIPLKTDNTDISAKYKKDRLYKISKSAIKQCHRSRLPIIEEEMTLFDVYNKFAEEYELKCAGIIGTKKWEIQNTFNSAIIFIGPPGDFSKREREFLINKNVVHLDLGETLLRSETAAIVAVTRILL